MLHVFVYVVRSTQDHFSGLQEALRSECDNRIIKLYFEESEFDYIDRVEYSERRFLRVFYYPVIFRKLCSRLDKAIAMADGEERVNVYFADEGVWAVVWADYRRRHAYSSRMRGVNVQHGLAEIRPSRFLGMRRLINMIARIFTGFPSLGYGSMGGAGPGAFDLYLTYDRHVANHVQKQTGCTAIPAPRLIKHELIKNFSALRQQRGGEDQGRVLFALNIKMRGSAIKCDMAETLDQLLELATTLRKLGACLVLRLHPGMDRDIEVRRFNSHPISRVAELDSYDSLQESMARSVMVMSFLSSVLWEASILGLVAVQVICRCCNTAKLHFERHQLVLNNEFSSSLNKLLALACTSTQRHWNEMERDEWIHVRPFLLD